jgi:hypothetical protein
MSSGRVNGKIRAHAGRGDMKDIHISLNLIPAGQLEMVLNAKSNRGRRIAPYERRSFAGKVLQHSRAIEFSDECHTQSM